MTTYTPPLTLALRDTRAAGYYVDFPPPSGLVDWLDSAEKTALLTKARATADAFHLRPGQLLKFTATGEVVTALDEPVALILIALDGGAQ